MAKTKQHYALIYSIADSTYKSADVWTVSIVETTNPNQRAQVISYGSPNIKNFQSIDLGEITAKEARAKVSDIRLLISNLNLVTKFGPAAICRQHPTDPRFFITQNIGVLCNYIEANI